MAPLAYLMLDPRYFLYLAPAILLGLWAQWRVKSAYHEAGKYRSRHGISGAEAARRILDHFGIHDVRVEGVDSFLGDHYSSNEKVLRLSPDVYEGQTLAALGIAAHEAGHAIQHASSYGPLVIRNGLVPVASIGSSLSWFLIMIGLVMSFFNLAVLGVALFGLVVLFQLINLPVEFDASRRARAVLLNSGMVTQDEDVVVGKVLSAAALTYVAATLTAILQLLYYLSLVSGGRRSS